MRNTIARQIFAIGPSLLVLFVTWSYGQIAVGTIKGIVTDPNGAVVPNTNLIFESNENGTTVTVTSNSAGEYVASNVARGTYRITCRFFEMFYSNPKVLVRPGEITNLEVIVSYEANCPVEKGVVLSLSDADRTEIVSSILKGAVGEQSFISDGHGKILKGPLVLSLSTIKPEWVAPELRSSLRLLTEKEVEEKANRSGDYLHLSFSGWHVGTSCVIVTLNNSWAVADDSPSVYLSGGGRTYLYRKDNAGKWVGKSIGGWIS